MLFLTIVLCTSAVLASVGIRPSGWLDRLVAYHKDNFLQDFNQVAPINLKVVVIPRPEGYVDPSGWDYGSAVRLLALIGRSTDAEPVKKALRRALRPSRRSMTHFFSHLDKKGKDDIFYPMEGSEDYVQRADFWGRKIRDDDVIIITNPVEARLPSARISVGLLKQILENRAAAARYMPTTRRPTMYTSTSKPTTTVKRVKTTEASTTPDITSVVTETPGTSDLTVSSDTTVNGDTDGTTTNGDDAAGEDPEDP